MFETGLILIRILNFIDDLGLHKDKAEYVYTNTAAPSSYFYRPEKIT